MTSIFILSSCDKDNTVNSKNLEGIWALHHITLYDGTSQEIDYKNPTTGCALYTFKKTGKDEFSMRIFTCYNANYDGSKPEYYWVGAPSMSTHVSDNKIQVAGVEMGDIKKLTSKGLTIKNQQMTMEMEKLSNNPDEIKKFISPIMEE